MTSVPTASTDPEPRPHSTTPLASASTSTLAILLSLLALPLLLVSACSVDHSTPEAAPEVAPGHAASPARAAELHFVDVSLEAGIRDPTTTKTIRASYGPLWADLNADGALDLIFMNHGHQPSIWINQADGTFQNVAETSGLRHDEPEYYNQWDRHGCACADYDNDGDLDLFITHGAAKGRTFGQKADELLRQDGTSLRFEDVALKAGTLNALGRGRFPTWVDIDSDGDLDLYVGNAGTANVLYRNNGDGSFSDATAETGLGLVEANRHAWADVDGDGDQDLITLPPLELYRNDGADGFVLVDAASSGLRGGGKGLAIADLDADGLPDLLVTRTAPALNQLLRNTGGRFEPIAAELGPRQGTVCKGAAWGDLDNDGSLDLVIACSDGLRLVRLDAAGVPRLQDLPVDSSLRFESDADVAIGDADGDGLLDVATVCADGNHLLRNTTGSTDPASVGGWIRLVLQGRASNRIGFGATVSLQLDDGRIVTRTYRGDTGSYGSMGCGPLHLGIGEDEAVEVEIRWPSGTVQTLHDVRPGQTIEVVEPSPASTTE